MQILFVTATGTNVGKTYAATQIIEALSKKNIAVGICKPIETGVRNMPMDASLLLMSVQKYNSAYKELKAEDITAYTFALPAAPYCADVHHTISIETIIDKVKELSQKCELLIVEGAGGLMVPITQEFLMIDLITSLNAKALLITSSRLGCINETLLSLEALNHRGIEHDWCVNIYDDHTTFASVTKPYYDRLYPNWWSLQDGLENYIESLL